MTAPTPPAPRKHDVRKHYLRILVTWVLTLVALYALQQYFS